MEERLQEIVNDLESLQYDILFWERKEKNKKKRKMLSDYDKWIEKIIPFPTYRTTHHF